MPLCRLFILPSHTIQTLRYKYTTHSRYSIIAAEFYGFGSGRFGHPEQDRALSLREGSLLQTFPKDYEFVPHGGPICFKRIARMVGNAVPVKIGKAIGETIMSRLGEFNE